MMDWADEIALSLAPDDEFTWPETEIAAALRKAKADGMREAAFYFESHGKGPAWLRQAADKIEKGNA